MNEKTPGQIAFEANTDYYGWTGKLRDWSAASPSDKSRRGFIGQAVARAVCPVPDPGQPEGRQP